jgi:hypothetical protein
MLSVLLLLEGRSTYSWHHCVGFAGRSSRLVDMLSAVAANRQERINLNCIVEANVKSRLDA